LEAAVSSRRLHCRMWSNLEFRDLSSEFFEILLPHTSSY